MEETFYDAIQSNLLERGQGSFTLDELFVACAQVAADFGLEFSTVPFSAMVTAFGPAAVVKAPTDAVPSSSSSSSSSLAAGGGDGGGGGGDDEVWAMDEDEDVRQSEVTHMNNFAHMRVGSLPIVTELFASIMQGEGSTAEKNEICVVFLRLLMKKMGDRARMALQRLTKKYNAGTLEDELAKEENAELKNLLDQAMEGDELLDDARKIALMVGNPDAQDKAVLSYKVIGLGDGARERVDKHSEAGTIKVERNPPSPPHTRSSPLPKTPTHTPTPTPTPTHTSLSLSSPSPSSPPQTSCR